MRERTRRVSAAQRAVEFLLILALAWGVFAFGAVYPWAYWPLIVALGMVTLASLGIRSERTSAPVPKGLAIAFAAFLAAGLLQVVPLPFSVLAAVSPESVNAISQLYLGFFAAPERLHAVSIAPELTWVGLALFASNALLVLACVRLFSLIGARRSAEGLAMLGVAVALTGIVQSRLYNGKIYGFWTTYEGGNPFGPFVNRNHFAGWMLMVLPLTLGVLSAGMARGLRGVKPNWHDRMLWMASSDASKLILLIAASIVMALSLVMTMSRSGILALGVVVVVTGAFAARRQAGSRRIVAVAYLLVLVIGITSWVGTNVIATRFRQSSWTEFAARQGAWTDARDVALKFPVAGTGLNTYDVAMLLYQRHDRARHYSQAHNDFLEVAAEGGLLLTVPAAACLLCLVAGIRRRFQEETSESTYWLRVGAVVALAAIGLQELVDFSLQMPGNAALFAVLCGIALHKTPRPHSSTNL